MLNKLNLAIVAGCCITAFGFSVQLFAEGDHAHKHAKSDHQNHEGAHWASPKEAAARTNPVASDEASIARGAKSYATLCVSCHGKQALGDGADGASLNPKPTNLKAMSGNHEDGDFAWKIANGRGAMPAWKGILNENQIWDLVNFIQDLKNEKKHEKSNEKKADRKSTSKASHNKHKHTH